MTTNSKTRSSFERLVRQKGAVVHWHRERGGADCPCLTPEGFRDAEWHIMYNKAFQDLGDSLQATSQYVSPGPITNISEIDYYIFGLVEPGIILGQNYLFTSATPNEFPSGFEVTFPNVVRPPISSKLSAVVFARSENDMISPPQIMYMSSLFNSPGDFTDNIPIGGYAQTIEQFGWVAECNDDGKLVTLNNIEDKDVKAFIQPAFISTRSRSNQLLMESFGEIQADDHIGIFPINYDGFSIDFADWSNSGTDWIEFNGMRFIAVTWNLLPAPDNANVNHHWEVALRRINQDLPSG